jgi:hypothetical protein
MKKVRACERAKEQAAGRNTKSLHDDSIQC